VLGGNPPYSQSRTMLSDVVASSARESIAVDEEQNVRVAGWTASLLGTKYPIRYVERPLVLGAIVVTGVSAADWASEMKMNGNRNWCRRRGATLRRESGRGGELSAPASVGGNRFA